MNTIEDLCGECSHQRGQHTAVIGEGQKEATSWTRCGRATCGCLQFSDPPIPMVSVLQEWVMKLPLMQQATLLTACRGPDGLAKEIPAKGILRWLRRCFLVPAFRPEKCFDDPYEDGGGSFMGASSETIDVTAKRYFESIDQMPLHFHMHLMHAAEIVGYKHPENGIRRWWNNFYINCAGDAHLPPECEAALDNRLSM